jgi:hypothetical protein
LFGEDLPANFGVVRQRDEIEAEKARQRRYSVRHNVEEFASLCWARSATKHRVSRARSRFVVERARCCFEEAPAAGGRNVDPRLWFFGSDGKGIPLELACVEDARGRLVVIHAMTLRARYKHQLEEARKWQARRNIR